MGIYRVLRYDNRNERYIEISYRAIGEFCICEEKRVLSVGKKRLSVRTAHLRIAYGDGELLLPVQANVRTDAFVEWVNERKKEG